MHILLSNDDGFRAAGIQELAQAMLAFGQVTIVAPDGPRSGFSGAITTTQPLRLKHRTTEGNLAVYSCEGTPVDCVKLALNTLFGDQRPDLIISGINHGSNEGICVSYSGTLGAAREGCIYGIPSLAVSLDDTAWHPDFSDSIDYTVRVVKMMLEKPPTLADDALAERPQDEAQGSEGMPYDCRSLRRGVRPLRGRQG